MAKVILYLIPIAILFNGCAAIAAEELFVLGLEQSATRMAARGVARAAARGIARRSFSRAGLRTTSAQQLVVNNKELLNYSLAQNLTVASGFLIWELDSVKVEAKIIDRSTIEIENRTTSLPGEIYIVNAEQLNVRSGPSVEYPAFMKVYKNKVVFMEGETNGWAKVKLGYDVDGYVNLKYITPISERQMKGNPYIVRHDPSKTYSFFVYSSCSTCGAVNVMIDNEYAGATDRYFSNSRPRQAYSEGTVSKNLTAGKHIITAIDAAGHKWYNEVNLLGDNQSLNLIYSPENDKAAKNEPLVYDSQNGSTTFKSNIYGYRSDAIMLGNPNEKMNFKLVFYTTCTKCGPAKIFKNDVLIGTIDSYFIETLNTFNIKEGTVEVHVMPDEKIDFKIVHMENGVEVIKLFSRNRTTTNDELINIHYLKRLVTPYPASDLRPSSSNSNARYTNGSNNNLYNNNLGGFEQVNPASSQATDNGWQNTNNPQNQRSTEQQQRKPLINIQINVNSNGQYYEPARNPQNNTWKHEPTIFKKVGWD